MHISPSSNRRFRRSTTALTALSLCAFGLGAVSAPAQAVDPASAADLASAVAVDPSVVAGASFVSTPPDGGTALSSTTPLLGFPRHGDSYAVLSSGDAHSVFPANPYGTENRNGPNVRGDTDLDVTVFKLDVTVPSGVNCLAGVDFRFLSVEYPTYVGTSFNDAFIFEIDESTWNTASSEILVDNNLAFDELGNLISINAAGAATMSADLAVGANEQFGGSTRTLTASAPISPGPHSLFFSIFDQGDQILDSAVLLDNLRFSQVADPATECQPGVTPNYGNPVTAPPATFNDDPANPSVTIPSSPSVVYYLDEFPVDAGEQPLTPGDQVTVTAKATGDDYLDGPSSWTHLVPGGEELTPATPAAPVFEDNSGTASDRVVITAATGVEYYLNGGLVAAGSHPATTGPNDVQAFPEPGYAIHGASYWQHTFSDSATLRLMPKSAGGTLMAVTPAEPTADADAGTFTIPASDGVEYWVNGETYGPGTYPGAGEVMIEAYSTSGEPLSGATMWSFYFPVSALEVATAAAPTFTENPDAPDKVTIPSVTGVNYQLNGAPVAAGEHVAVGGVTVAAMGAPGYRVEGVSGWSKTFFGNQTVEVTPTAPTFTDVAGTAGDVYTIPSQVGVRYVVDGDVVAPGDHPAAGTVTIDAVPTAGYTLSGTTTWTRTFSAATELTRGTPAISGKALQGKTLTADAGTWSPEGVSLAHQWLRNGGAISGATATSYVLKKADVGKKISVRVTGTLAGYDSAAATSAQSKPVVGLLTTKKPTINGKPKVGKTLTAVPGKWKPKGITFSYKWFRGTKAIKGAKGKTYTLKKADKGKKIKVKVTGKKAGYKKASVMSAATPKVK